jgi:outer membrane protein assembly factor BamB
MKLNKFVFFLMMSLIALLASACTVPVTGGFPAAVVSQDIVYVSGGPAVLALKADGTLLWRYPEKNDAAKTFFAPPLVIKGLVVVGDYQNTLFALDANSTGVGVEKWSFKDAKGRFIGGAVSAADKIIAPNADGNLYALDDTGKLVWKFTAKAGLWGTPVVEKDILYIASMDHFLYALKASDGSQVWATDLGASSVATPLLTSDGMLFVGTLGNQMVAVQKASGAVIWKFDTTGAVWATPVLKDGMVFFGDLSNKIYALSSKEGTIAWSGDAPGPIVAAPAVISDGMAFVCETGEVLLVGFKNERSWTDKVANGKLYSTPAVIADRLVMPVDQGDPLMVTYDYSGRKGWTFAAPK